MATPDFSGHTGHAAGFKGRRHSTAENCTQPSVQMAGAWVRLLFAALFTAASLVVAHVPAFAFDPDKDVRKGATQAEIFKFGFNAMQSGDVENGLAALNHVADRGHVAANWMLGKVYAQGKGVKMDRGLAFKYLDRVTRAYDSQAPSRATTSFATDAFEVLAEYYLEGVPDAGIERNVQEAIRNYQAAAWLGNAEALFAMGKINYEGVDEEPNFNHAAGYFDKARRSGHVGATALLGHMYFEGKGVKELRVRGLTLMYVATARIADAKDAWIRNVKDEAFSKANETEQRLAIALARKELGLPDMPDAENPTGTTPSIADGGGASVPPTALQPTTEVADWRKRIFQDFFK